MSIQQIGVVGAGTMARIAQACAVAAFRSSDDIAQSAVDRGLKTIDGSLERLVKKEKLSARPSRAWAVRTATDTRRSRTATS